MTKQQIVEEATSLISNFPQAPLDGGGGVIFTSSAERFYDILLPSFMESFVYGFGVVSQPLNNPIDNPDDSSFKRFAVPKNIGFIITCLLYTSPSPRD